jgi:filamentous hemagglutinin family protein
MNHIYRSIWNEKTGTFVAVSETTKSGSKNASAGGSVVVATGFALKVLAASLLMAFGTNLYALPVNGVVAAGVASITSGTGSMTVNQTSQNAVLNWQSFNIGQGETVRFVQPNSSAVALNRVLGADPSSILGNLSANGQVFLVNPNGILFGKGASVNVGGLVASTLNISDSDFMVGRYKFAGTGGTILNQGSINADGGYVALLGANVSNQGTITARLGTVALAAGNAITLDLAGDGLINVSIDQGAVNALVENGGMLKADGGHVLMSAQAAGDLLHTAVNNTGVIQAQAIENRDGTIRLLGDMQTGTVNVAGKLDASAPAGGNGGFIDTSAANVRIADNARITTAAAMGLSGTWLIDPVDFTIAAGSAALTSSGIGATTLSTSLASGNVSIATGSTTAGNGDIFVNSAVSWAANKLTLSAHRDININANLNASASASLALNFGQGATYVGNTSNVITNNGAAVNLPAGTTNYTTKQGGNGTVKNYTVITSLGAEGSITQTDLQGMQGNRSRNYALGANIDASATSGWNAGAGFEPLGPVYAPFSGSFDGMGHTISNLTINRPTTDYVGLFGRSFLGNPSDPAIVRNLGLVAGSVTGRFDVGSLIGDSGFLVFNSYATGAVAGSSNVGGLVGTNNHASIINSHATGAVTGSGDNIGGLVGNNSNVGLPNVINANLSNSYATGAVSGSSNVGGLVGVNNSAPINNSHATGAVTGSGNNIGGLVGNNTSSMNYGDGSIANSYATGAVRGGSNVGGLVGVNAASAGGAAGYGVNTGPSVTIANSYATGAVSGSNAVGGLVGGNFGGNGGDGNGGYGGSTGGAGGAATINNSYAAGAVSGSSLVGGLIGKNANGAVGADNGGTGGAGGLTTVTNSFWDTTTSGQASSAAGTGLTSVQMQGASNFTGFNFTTTPGAGGNNWVMVGIDGTLNSAGGTRPMLASEYSTTINNAHQLQLMSMNLAGNYTLGQNIDAAATGTVNNVWSSGTFVPVGKDGARFTGTLDGLGHTIGALNINMPDSGLSGVSLTATADEAGLFGHIGASGSVQNVGLVGGSVVGRDFVGALAGTNDGTITNSYASTTVQGRAYVGGLVGHNTSTGTTNGSHAAGGVTASGGTVGGLVGMNVGVLSNDYATGAVQGGENYVGGLVGLNQGPISNSYASGSVSGSVTGSSYVGGLIGMNFHDSISNSYATGAVQGNGFVAGLIGFNYTGGITNSYATGSVQGVSNAGGLMGNNYGAVTNSFWNTDTSGQAASVGGTGLTTQQMMQLSSFSSWNTATPNTIASTGNSGASWRIYEGHTAPLLTQFLTTLTRSDAVVTTYNGTAQGATGSFPSGVFVATATNAGTYDAFYSNQQGYDISGGTLTINKAVLTLSGTRAYDGTSAIAGSALTATGVAGQTFAVTGAGDTSNLASKNVQTASTLANLTGLALGTSGNGGLTGNYNALSTNGSAINIGKANLTVSTTDVSKTYDGGLTATGTVTLTSGSLFGSDTLSGGNFAYTDKNVGAGNKTVTTNGVTVTDGNSGGNYNVTYANNTTSTISQAILTATASASNKIYDGNTTAAATLSIASGLVGTETVTATGAGTFNTKDVATANLVTVNSTALADGSNGGLASNYSLASGQTAAATIATKSLTISDMTAANKVYDGNTVATLDGGALNGLVGTETLGLAGHTGSFADKNVGMNKIVTVTGTTLTDGTGLASNYSVTNPSGLVADITRLASVAWVGGASGSWFDPANWAGGAVPDQANVANVVIPAGVTVSFDNGTVQLDSIGRDGSLQLVDGTLNVATSLRLASLAQSGGSIVSSGPVELGSFNQSGGTLAGSGDLTVTNHYQQTSSAGSVGIGGNVTITQTSGSTSLGKLATAGTLAVTVGNGDISQLAGTSIAAVASTLKAPNGTVTLDAGGNDLGTVVISDGSAKPAPIDNVDKADKAGGSGDTRFSGALAGVASMDGMNPAVDSADGPSSTSSRDLRRLPAGASVSGILGGLNVTVSGHGVRLPPGVQPASSAEDEK